jgi:hypothetical protein
MQILLAVLDDLWRFMLQSLFGTAVFSKASLETRDTLLLLQPQLPLLPPGQRVTQPFVYRQGDLYVRVSKALIRLDPVVAFDNILLALPYGTAVSILKGGARWSLVQYGDVTGWVQKDQVSDVITEVFPPFSNGSAYDASAPATEALRLVIGDAFGAVDPELPLSAPEYVTYRLRQSGRQINWPMIRPRSAGSWQKILRGQSGTHLSITPKTGAVMECTVEENSFLLYVEAVFPNESIQVSAVGYEGLGVYSEHVWEKEFWRELRPVFIEVL